MWYAQADQAGSRASLRIAAIAFGAMVLALGGRAHAQALEQEPTAITVSYSDLDLTRQADAAVLYQRLKMAARRACDSRTDLRNLRLQALQQRCYEDSLQQAVAQVGHSSIKALYVASTGAPAARL